MNDFFPLIISLISAGAMCLVAIIQVKGQRDRTDEKKLNQERHDIMLQILEGQKVNGELAYATATALKKIDSGQKINGEMTDAMKQYLELKREREQDIVEKQAGSFNQTQNVTITNKQMSIPKAVAICVISVVIAIMVTALINRLTLSQTYTQRELQMRESIISGLRQEGIIE